MIIMYILKLRRELPKYLDLNVDLPIPPVIAWRQDIVFFSSVTLHMPQIVDLY